MMSDIVSPQYICDIVLQSIDSPLSVILREFNPGARNDDLKKLKEKNLQFLP